MARLLLIAPTCDGDDVGEAWVAHQWAQGLASRHDTTILTYHKRGSRPAAEQLQGARVIEWTEPRGLGRFERLNSMLKPGYFPFYLHARRWIRDALARGERFDVAHQPVPVAMRYPCPARGFGIPYVLGPVGGGLPDPPGFADVDESSPWFVHLRRLDQVRLRVDPTLRQSYSDAACVLGIAPYVLDQLDGIPLRRFETMSETALTQLPDTTSAAPARGTGPMRLLFVGRLVTSKGPRLLIEAMSHPAVRDLPAGVVLDVIGDGPERAACEEAIREHGLSDRVTLHGRLSRPEIDPFYEASDVFVFPSYREPGGNVVFEAMGHGLPLIVCRRGGPGAATTEASAIRLEVDTPARLVDDLAQAIRELALNPERRRAMGVASRARVESVGLWERKFDQFDALVQELVP